MAEALEGADGPKVAFGSMISRRIGELVDNARPGQPCRHYTQEVTSSGRSP
jgi:hypothetical protein